MRVVATGRRAAVGPDARPVPVTIAGPLCSGLDVLAHDAVMVPPRVGDLVAVLDVGRLRLHRVDAVLPVPRDARRGGRARGGGRPSPGPGWSPGRGSIGSSCRTSMREAVSSAGVRP